MTSTNSKSFKISFNDGGDPVVVTALDFSMANGWVTSRSDAGYPVAAYPQASLGGIVAQEAA